MSRFLKFAVVGAVLGLGIGYGLNYLLTPIGLSREVLPLVFPLGDMQDPTEVKFASLVRLATAQGRGFCSAWIIDKHYAITAAHCVNNRGIMNRDNLKFYDINGEDIGVVVKVAGYDIRTDLGLLTGDFHTIAPLATNFNGEGFPRTRETHYVSCGFPLAQKKAVCTTFIPKGTVYFAVEGYSHLIPGMSGGAVIDLDTGYAVAVNTAVYDNMSVVSPVEGMLGLFGLD